MAGESNADVYASFGVNSAVMTSDSQEAHEQNMLALDVAARDGDDAITLEETTQDDPYGNPDKFADPDDDRLQIRINSEGTHDDTEVNPEGEESGEETGDDDGEFKALGDIPEEINSAADQLGKHEEGFNSMVEQAMERGLTADLVDQIYGEYSSDEGISDASYEALAKAGYSREFVESYCAGQEALVNDYVNQIVSFAGGADKFTAIHNHMETTDPASAEALEAAVERRDIATVRALLNSAGQSYAAKFGKPAQRSVTTRGIPAKATAAKKSEGFATQAEMIKAMSDSRYRTDSVYRREVEQKVIDSKF